MQVGVIGLVLAGAFGLVAAVVAQDRKVTAVAVAGPRCVDDEMTTGPGAAGARAAQETTDVVGHYEQVLEADGWTVVEEEPAMLRAEKDGRAFEVSGDGLDWTVWTGPTRGVAP